MGHNAKLMDYTMPVKYFMRTIAMMIAIIKMNYCVGTRELLYVTMAGKFSPCNQIAV